MPAPTDTVVRFGRYLLHPRRGLIRGRREVHVTHKALQVLAVLAARPGVLVTKHELFETVWSDTAVSDAALTSCIQELRQALQDDARKPRFIETLHRRGFRFLPATRIEQEHQPVADVARDATASPTIGRETAIAQMEASLDAAIGGSRQLVVVSGEAGIGKTALVEGFAARQLHRPGLSFAAAACVERWTASEPYHPLLEAVVRLCRTPNGNAFRTALRRYAPTWYAQLPMFQTPATRRSLEKRTVGVTRERMHRELTDCLEAASSHAPLVLWLDDVHWSDLSTSDWIAAFVQRPEPTRILLIVTFRPGTSHPFEAAFSRLRLKPWCRSIALTGLALADVEELVIHQSGWPPSAAVHRFARELHAHTEGHPLFVRVLLDELGAHGMLGGPGAPSVVPSDESIARLGVPETLRQLIERQVDQLNELERTLLEAASVLGMEWSSAAAAAAVDRDAAEVEPVLAGLTRREAFVRRTGVGEWPDGTRSDAFAFVHAIHRSVLERRLSSARRTRIHRLIGERIETAYDQQVREAAPQLAVHFEEAGDLDKAVRYLKLASETASRRGAAEEAHATVSRALDLLGRTAASPARDQQELDLQIARGSVLMAARGWGAPEVEQAYDRARELCSRMPPGARLFRSLWGLWLFRWGRSDLATAASLAEELERLSSASIDETCRLQTHHAHWATAFSTGDLDAACRHARAGSALASSVECDLATYGQHDAGVCAQLFLARARAAAGDIDEGDRAAEDALARARDLDHPFTLALSLVFTAAVSHLAGRAGQAGERAAEAASLSEAHGFRLLGAWAEALAGWSLVQQGDGHRALSRIAAGVESAHATGSRQFRTYLLGIVGEAHLKAGNLSPGLAAVNEALRWAGASGERFYEAELHRLRGGLIAASGGGIEDASASYDRAIAIAEEQGARLFLERAIRDRSVAGQR